MKPLPDFIDVSDWCVTGGFTTRFNVIANLDASRVSFRYAAGAVNSASGCLDAPDKIPSGCMMSVGANWFQAGVVSREGGVL